MQLDTHQNQLNDELHEQSVSKHSPMWLYVVSHYKNEAYSPIVGLGDLVVSPLIELSQWGYPITYISDAYDRMLSTEIDLETLAGSFEKMFYSDFIKNCPRGRIIMSIGIVERLGNDDMFRWIDLLTRRGSEVLFAVPSDRDWYNLLSHKYDIFIDRYSSGDYYLLSIKNKYGTQKSGKGKNSSTRSQVKMVEEKPRKDTRRKKKSNSKPKINNGKS